MTDGGELPPGEVRRREAVAARRRECAEWAETEVGGLSDWELIGAIPPKGISYPMEIDRRLKAAVEALTEETVSSRESAERLTGQLDGSVAGLTAELVTFRQSADEAAGRADEAAAKLTRLTWVLIVFTVVLVVLTVVLVVLTIRLLAQG